MGTAFFLGQSPRLQNPGLSSAVPFEHEDTHIEARVIIIGNMLIMKAPISKNSAAAQLPGSYLGEAPRNPRRRSAAALET